MQGESTPLLSKISYQIKPSLMKSTSANHPRLLALLSALAVPLCTPSCSTMQRADPTEGIGDVSKLEDRLSGVAFAIADKNKDGVVTFDELQAANPATEAAMFPMNDADSSGALSPVEFETAINRAGGFDLLYAKIDTDGDGLVSEAETLRFERAIEGAENLQNLGQLKKILD